MARPFSVSGFAADVRRRSGFVGIAIVDNVIAAPPAANKPGANNGAAPIAVTSTVTKHGSTIGTGNEPIANGGPSAA